MDNPLQQSAKEAAKEVIQTAKETADTLLTETRQAQKEDHKEFVFMLKKYFDDNDTMMKGHFADDIRSFGGINKKLEEIQEESKRRGELAKIQAEHFSAMGLELAKMNINVNDMLPILQEWREDREWRSSTMRRMKNIGGWTKGVAVFIGGCAAIWGLIKGFFILFVR